MTTPETDAETTEADAEADATDAEAVETEAVEADAEAADAEAAAGETAAVAAPTLGREPIGESAPAGEDCRYGEEFEKLESLVNAAPIDADVEDRWEQVVALSTTILATQAKDIGVACYLTVGLMETKQAEGLAEGLAILQDLLAAYWDDGFPPARRKRGRINAIQWLYEKTVAFLQHHEIPPQPRAVLEALKTRLSGVDEVLQEKLADDAPLPHEVKSQIDAIAVKPEPKPAAAGEVAEVEATPAGAARSATAPASAPATAAAGAIDSAASAERALNAALGNLRPIARWYIQNDTANPAGYRLTRLAAWTTVEGRPPAEKNTTMIPPPEEPLVNALKNQYGQGNWASLLEGAESNIQRFLFWLDLNRFSYEALDGLGGKHQLARDVIAKETVAYNQRLGGVEGLSFSDGTPFADGATQAWLEEMAAEHGGAEGGGAGGQAYASGGEQIYDVYKQARELYKDKKISEAFLMLEQRMHQAGSGREEFLWRVALCKLLAGGKTGGDLLEPHLDWIVDEIEHFNLEEWEPELVLEGLSIAYRHWANQTDEDKLAKAQWALGQLALMSPADAMGLQK